MLAALWVVSEHAEHSETTLDVRPTPECLERRAGVGTRLLLRHPIEVERLLVPIRTRIRRGCA